MKNKSKRNRKAAEPISQIKSPNALFEISEDLLHKNFHLELNGNREAIVEGCTGILEYNDYSIKLNTAKYVICFMGTDLQIQCMTTTGAVIQGNIHSVQFLN